MRRMILPLLYVSNFRAQSAHTETDRRLGAALRRSGVGAASSTYQQVARPWPHAIGEPGRAIEQCEAPCAFTWSMQPAAAVASRCGSSVIATWEWFYMAGLLPFVWCRLARLRCPAA